MSFELERNSAVVPSGFAVQKERERNHLILFLHVYDLMYMFGLA